MLSPKDFYNILLENNIHFFTGVPDSLLKYFNSYILDHANHHVIAANEGASIALAAGYHLATKNIGLVYLQNSGQGNMINPLTSLADKEVYSIPILLLVGWRGEPGVKDEPQHIKQGRITKELFETLGIPYKILSKDIESARKDIESAKQYMKKNNAPHALIVEKNTFEKYLLINIVQNKYILNREEAIKIIIDNLDEEAIVVSTTGKASRELFEYRQELRQGLNKDFLTVGCMGHTSQIALGISFAKPNRQVICIDGDGSVIMHMGALATIGKESPEKFLHIILNNESHDSVGGQPTAATNLYFTEIAKSCGYNHVVKAKRREEIISAIKLLEKEKGPSLIEINVNKGSRKDLGRPTITPKENKELFMRFLEK